MLDEGNRSLATALSAQAREFGLAAAVKNAFIASVGESFEPMTRSLMPIIFGDAALRRVWESANFRDDGTDSPRSRTPDRSSGNLARHHGGFGPGNTCGSGRTA